MTLEEQYKEQLEAIGTINFVKPFTMFIQEITNLDDVEEADWEEETE